MIENDLCTEAGHCKSMVTGPWVSLRSWQCDTCDKPVSDGLRERLSNVASQAPPGFLWILLNNMPSSLEELPVSVSALVSNRQTLFEEFKRKFIDDLEDYEWWQCVPYPTDFLAYKPDDDWPTYRLELVEIDRIE